MNKKTYLKSILAFAFLLGLTSCIDVIDLKTDGSEEVLIVEGFVYRGLRPPEVNIRRSASFASGPDGVELPVSGAKVTLSKVGGSDIELIEQEPGFYTLDAYETREGESYSLKIEVDGNVYESLVEKIPPLIPVTNLSWARREEMITNEQGNVATQSIIILQSDANFPEAEGGAFLRHRVSGAYEYRERSSPTNLNDLTCFVPERIDFNNLSLVDGRLVNGQLLDEPILERIIDFKFAYNYCFTVVHQSISNNAFNYWNSIVNEFERTGDIFEAPPAKIKGNILNSNSTKNDVIGLFSAINADTSNLLVSGIELGNPRIPCRSFGFVPEACEDCLIITNSTLERPNCFQ